jgi:phosphoglycolate phosphatase
LCIETKKDLNHIKGLLFDKDGTLIDFSASWLQPMKDVTGLIADRAGQADLQMKLLVDGGYEPESDSWAKDSAIAFETSENIYKRWASMVGPELIESLLPEIQAIIFASLEKAVPVIGNMAGLFSQLTNHYTLGVASMDDEINVKQTLSGLNLHHHMTFYCGADSGHGIKPGPGMVHAFCKRANLAPEQVAVIGDAVHDLKMARAAGSIAIGVLSGASSAQTLSEHADILITDIGGLTQYLPA